QRRPMHPPKVILVDKVLLSPMHSCPAHQPQDSCDTEDDNNSLRLRISRDLEAKRLQHTWPVYHTLLPQRRVKLTEAVVTTAIGTETKFVDHQAAENVGLIVDVVKDVFVKDVEGTDWDHKSIAGHPNSVGHSSQGKGADEIGKQGGHENHQALGGDKVK